MLAALILVPAFAGLLMLLVTHDGTRRILLLAVAGTHFTLVCLCAARPSPPMWNGILDPDAPGLLFLCISSLLFLVAAFYGVGYLRTEAQGPRRSLHDNESFTNLPEQRFCACLCFFPAAMSLISLTRHPGVLWMGIECTTLATAPLIYFHRHRRSLEAAWKYLIICSVGIALALIGNILFAFAFHTPGTSPVESMNLPDLVAAAKTAHPAWLKAAFFFILVGYGVKMGLAPLHNWLPDAHSEAPSLVSALLSGALLNCAFLGILRAHQILVPAGLGDFSGGLLIFFGFLSMGTAAVFIVGMGHFKRLLAYSSVEHMGILALGVGIGGQATFGAMLHAVNHSLTKAMLFLLAGNILTHYRTVSSHDVRGMRRLMPMTASLWTAGFLAIAGSPPFGLFVSEFTILKAMLESGRGALAFLYLALLAVIFVGMSAPVLHMVQSSHPPAVKEVYREDLFNTGPPLVLCAVVLMLGLYIPEWLETLLLFAARAIGA